MHPPVSCTLPWSQPCTHLCLVRCPRLCHLRLPLQPRLLVLPHARHAHLGRELREDLIRFRVHLRPGVATRDEGVPAYLPGAFWHTHARLMRSTRDKAGCMHANPTHDARKGGQNTHASATRNMPHSRCPFRSHHAHLTAWMRRLMASTAARAPVSSGMVRSLSSFSDRSSASTPARRSSRARASAVAPAWGNGVG